MSKPFSSRHDTCRKPTAVLFYCILLITFSLFPDASALVKVYQIQSFTQFGSWLMDLALILIGVTPPIIAGLAIWKNQNWGWWLAGIYLGFRIAGSLIAIIAISASMDGGEYLLQVTPGPFVQPAIIFIVSSCMLAFLYLIVPTRLRLGEKHK